MATQTSGAGPKNSGSGYFDTRRGEVNELGALLSRVSREKDGQRKRDVIKKVIAFMTLGIDVSRLFSEMVMASNTKDLVVKKMVYLYLCTYAVSNPDLVLLTINTLQKDCRDDDPMVRGLALRSLCSLRLETILEYAMTPLKQCLSDRSAYVRKTAVIGVLKVYHLKPELVKESDFVDTLYNMIRDRDALVVTNCIRALNEILSDEGGIVINQAIVHHLLNRIREFSDWGMVTVLEVVAKYKTASQNETFGIMNLIDPCLRVSNSAVVFAATQCFLQATREMPNIRTQVYERLKTPLLTLMASATHELAFVVLKHVALIVDIAPAVFSADYKAFFCRYNDPSSVNGIKMDVLPKIANESNANDIVFELAEYISGVDPQLAQHAIRSIGQIAIQVPQACETVIERLVEILDMEAEGVLGETVVVLRDLLRKFPEKAGSVIPSVHQSLGRMEDSDGKAAVVWMIGEYGQQIDEAPYLLEPLIDNVDNEQAVEVRLQMLTAAVKLFFKRPPEMQKMLGRLFEATLNEAETPIVRDRALLYYRLLRTDVNAASTVVNATEKTVERFLEDESQALREQLLIEFNTLSVIYGKPEISFVSEGYVFARPGAEAAKEAQVLEDDLLGGLGDSSEPHTNGSTLETQNAPKQENIAAAASAEDDLLGDFGSVTPTSSVTSQRPQVSLSPSASMEPQTFQQNWSTWTVSASTSFSVTVPQSTGMVESTLGQIHLKTLASGGLADHFKFFLYGQESNTGKAHCIELLIYKQPQSDGNNARIQIKSDAGANGEAVAALVQSKLAA